jgi:hypothetical protein
VIFKTFRNSMLSKNCFHKSLLLSAFVFISACGSDPNLGKVREFSENAAAAASQLPEITGDFYPSCLRAARYFAVDVLPADDQSSILSTVTAVEIEALSERIAGLEANPALSPQAEQLQQLRGRLDRLLSDVPSDAIADPNFLQARVDAQKACNETQQFASEVTPQIPSLYLGSLMDTGNAVIVGYLRKMGELAGAGQITFDEQFSSLTASSTSLTKEFNDLFGVAEPNSSLTTERVTAGLGLVNFIVNQIFEGQRRETLEEAITLGNEPLKSYSEGLQLVVDRVYIDQYLRTEESFLDQYYIEYISAVLDSNERRQGDSVTAIVRLLLDIDDDWNKAKDEIQSRRELGFNYIKLLQVIIDGHQELANIYNSGGEPSSQAIERLLDESNLALKEFIEKAQSVDRSESNFRYD